MDKKNIEEKLKKILSEEFDIRPDEIIPETRLVEDLGADSLAIIETVIKIEGEFGLNIFKINADDPKDVSHEEDNLKTFADLVECVQNGIPKTEKGEIEKIIADLFVEKFPNEKFNPNTIIPIPEKNELDTRKTEFIIALEDEFEIEIPNEDTAKINQLDDAIDYVWHKTE